MAFSPDGKRIAIGGGISQPNHPYNLGRIWNVAGTNEEFRLIHGGPVNAIRFSPDGSKIATGTIYWLWDIESAKCVFKSGILGLADALEFSPRGDIVATGSGYRTIYLWNVPPSDNPGKLEGHTAPVTALAFSPTDDILVSAGNERDRTIRIWDYRRQELLQTLTIRQELDDLYAHRIVSLKFFPDGKSFASYEQPGIVRIWDVAGGKQIRRWNTIGNGARCLDISPDGKTLATCGAGNLLAVWDRNGTLQKRWGLDVIGENLVWTLAYAPDGKTLAAAFGSKIGLFDLNTWRLANTIDLILKEEPGAEQPPDGASGSDEIKGVFLQIDSSHRELETGS